MMDSLYKVHIGETIFPFKWNKEDTSAVAKRIFGWKADAWHIAKSLMIISLAFGAVFYKPIFGRVFDVVLFGAAWIFPFTLFYEKIFKIKTNVSP